MRFDARAVSLATYFAILLFNVYTLVLYFNQQLALYTNPRYVWFTAIFNAISAVACAVGIILTAWRMGKGSIGGLVVPWRPSFTLVVAALVLVAAYALPARTLSSDIASQRTANFNNTPTQTSGSGNTLALFGTDTTRLTIADWASAFNLKTNANFYAGKKVDLVGFVFHPKGTPSDVFYVSRFRMTCCAVDAQPIGVPVYSPGWREKFEEDSWVRVTGSFTETDQDIAEPAIVSPQSIERTDQPANPYVT